MTTETTTSGVDIDAIRQRPLAAEPGNNTFVVWYDPNNEPYAVYFRSDTNAWDDDQRWFNADQAGGDLDGPFSWDNLREELRGNDGPHLLVPAAKVDELTAELARVRVDERNRIAADIENMPINLGDAGWKHLETKADEASYPAEWVRRRRTRDDFTTATIEVAYQYGYRQAAKVARGEVAR